MVGNFPLKTQCWRMMANLSIAHILPKRVADIYLMRQRVLDLSKKLNCLCLSGGYI